MHEFEERDHWHRRGDFMPHYDKAGKYQMITYRLADSLPKKVLESLPSSKETGETPVLPAEKKRKLIESYLD